MKDTGGNLSNEIHHVEDRLIGFEFTVKVYIKENKSSYMEGAYKLYLTI